MTINQVHPTYLEFGNEVYRITTPTLSVHNLILGTPYMDIGGTATVTRLINRTENIKFEIKFKNRGWFSNSEDFGASAKLLDASGKSMGVAI